MKKDGFKKTEEQEIAVAPDQRSRPCRILVVDDEAGNRQLNMEMLTEAGYHVNGAADGAAGWQAIQVYNFDLVITDNRMPRMTGVDMIRKVHAAGIDLPIMMATGVMPKEFAESPWLKPAAILLKPYTVAQVLGTVQKILGPAQSGSAA